jgi:hypothetical protein
MAKKVTQAEVDMLKKIFTERFKQPGYISKKEMCKLIKAAIKKKELPSTPGDKSPHVKYVHWLSDYIIPEKLHNGEWKMDEDKMNGVFIIVSKSNS